jgi:hypothetical protein
MNSKMPTHSGTAKVESKAGTSTPMVQVIFIVQKGALISMVVQTPPDRSPIDTAGRLLANDQGRAAQYRHVAPAQTVLGPGGIRTNKWKKGGCVTFLDNLADEDLGEAGYNLRDWLRDLLTCGLLNHLFHK